MADSNDSKLNLSMVAGEAAQNAFNEHGHQTMTLEQRYKEGLGIRISQWTEWDGHAIMIIFAAALEDANFHTEAEQVLEWIAKMDAS